VLLKPLKERQGTKSDVHNALNPKPSLPLQLVSIKVTSASDDKPAICFQGNYIYQYKYSFSEDYGNAFKLTWLTLKTR